MSQESNFLSVKETADKLGWGIPKVLRALKKGTLEGAEKVGGWTWIIPRETVEALLPKDGSK